MLNFVENDLGLRAPKPGGGWRWDVGGGGILMRVGWVGKDPEAEAHGCTLAPV